MGMKNIFELGGVIDSRDSYFSFLRRSIPFFPSDDIRDCTKNTKDHYNRGPFCRGIIRDGHGKDFRHQRANCKHDKLKFIRNKTVLKVTNKTHESVTFGKTKIMGIVDIRSLVSIK